VAVDRAPSEVLRPVAEAPADALVAVDFDGTLSPIVDDPASARPVDGVPEALDRLARHVGEVAVVSGRPLEFLEQWFPMPSPVTVVGLYGLELRRDGRRQDHPSSGVWRETISDVATRARLQGPSAMDVEPKGLSITLHYRRHPGSAAEVERWAHEVAGPAGLRVRPARMSVELHPPIEEDKGTVLARLAADHAGPILFAGDDVGDLPAFALLEELRDGGRPVVRIVVDSAEAPTELRDHADLLVEGPPAMARLVDQLDRSVTGT
jgi:trehalose 6-phosphate phosphatase